MRPILAVSAYLRSRSDRRGQSGYMLAAVIVVFGFFAVISAALMAMTITVLRVTEQHDRSARSVRAADGAMEIVTNDLRLDASAAGSGCVGSGSHHGYSSSYGVSTTLDDGSVVDVVVECAAVLTTGRREVTFTARPGPDWAVEGVARVRIDDTADGSPRPGASVLVCDWQLGDAVAGSAAPCPT